MAPHVPLHFERIIRTSSVDELSRFPTGLHDCGKELHPGTVPHAKSSALQGALPSQPKQRDGRTRQCQCRRADRSKSRLVRSISLYCGCDITDERSCRRIQSEPRLRPSRRSSRPRRRPHEHGPGSICRQGPYLLAPPLQHRSIVGELEQRRAAKSDGRLADPQL